MLRKADEVQVLLYRTGDRGGVTRSGHFLLSLFVDDSYAYTVVGGGAIGATLAVALSNNGHPVTVVDTDADRVAALRHGVRLRDGDREYCARIAATLPELAPPSALQRVLLATKTQNSDAALRWIAPRLADDGFVVSCQNGDNERTVSAAVGAPRSLLAMIDIAADVLEPGVVRLGGSMDVTIGETGGRVSERARSVASDLRPLIVAEASDNVVGAIWSKRGLGAVLTASALADEHVAVLVDDHRELMARLLATVYEIARRRGIRLVALPGVDATLFAPGADSEAMANALEPLVKRFVSAAKDRSGVFRDIAVHRRRTEAHDELAALVAAAEEVGVDPALLRHLDRQLTDLEEGHRAFGRANLAELAATAAAVPPSVVEISSRPRRPASR